MNLKFKKELSGRWYIDLPEWTGPKSDLEMVAGADTMLDIVSEGNSEVELFVKEEPFDNSVELSLVSLATDIGEGAYYLIKSFNGVELNLIIWLCDVTKFVLGGFPDKIYFVKYE